MHISNPSNSNTAFSIFRGIGSLANEEAHKHQLIYAMGARETDLH